MIDRIMRALQLPKLYPLTDGAHELMHAEQVARLCAGGATLIQLRAKHASPREFYAAAEAALRVARAHGARLIINDRADIALALRADGVHLGQDDLAPTAARRLLGPDAIIGYSTHNLEQARAAAHLPINYIAIGPVFATKTKANPDPFVGLTGVTRVRAALPPTLPLVAIGGITKENARAVLRAGADSVAVVSALLDEPELIAARTAEFWQSLEHERL
ncbi:MAG: thiamine phosphate synthase [Acidobacteria bacterium]|nr:MAG: thiamine phosphate synthase [Acidobacteriota bacterium]